MRKTAQGKEKRREGKATRERKIVKKKERGQESTIEKKKERTRQRV